MFFSVQRKDAVLIFHDFFSGVIKKSLCLNKQEASEEPADSKKGFCQYQSVDLKKIFAKLSLKKTLLSTGRQDLLNMLEYCKTASKKGI